MKGTSRERTPRRRCLSDWFLKKGLVRFFTIFTFTRGCTIFAALKDRDGFAREKGERAQLGLSKP